MLATSRTDRQTGADSALPTYFGKGRAGLMTLSRREFRLCQQIGTSSWNTQMKVAFLGRCLPQWLSPAQGRGDGGRAAARRYARVARLQGQR